jgi:hypothetical protein
LEMKASAPMAEYGANSSPGLALLGTSHPKSQGSCDRDFRASLPQVHEKQEESPSTDGKTTSPVNSGTPSGSAPTIWPSLRTPIVMVSLKEGVTLPMTVCDPPTFPLESCVLRMKDEPVERRFLLQWLQ